jgi:acyl carrier protein
MSDTFEKIKEIVAQQLDIEADLVVPEANFLVDLKADSLDVVELVMKFETEFDIDIDDSVASDITIVQDALDYIEKFRKD